MRRLVVASMLLGLGCWISSPAMETDASPAKKAATTEADEIAAIRQQGPAALQRLLAEYDWLKKLAPQGLAKAARSRQPDLAELERRIDLVAGQKGAVRSRLFWFTDFEQAKRAAANTGKPILSLRLLGNLTDDLRGCAFFISESSWE